MKGHVKTWGNSLAVRIPKAAAEQLQLSPDSEVRLTVVDGGLLVQPHRQAVLTELLDRVTPASLHAEAKTSDAQGREIW